MNQMPSFKFFAPVLLGALLAVSCGTGKQSAGVKALSYTSSVTSEDRVSRAGVPDYTVVSRPEIDLKSLPRLKGSWYVLFDGTRTDGWRGYAKDHLPSRWSIEDGCLRLKDRKAGEAAGLEGGDILFEHRFRNFELELEWKIAKGGNSGIFYLAREVRSTRNGKPWDAPMFYSAPEYQVLDNANHPDARKGVDGNRKSASLYDMIPARPQNQNPYGEWNKVRIVVRNGKVTHFQNGVEVVSYELGTPEWAEMLKASKFNPGKNPLAYDLLLGCGVPGYIGLQDHGNDVWYRNIRIKILK